LLSDETAKALKAIQLLNRPDIAVDVVVGFSNPHKEMVKRLCCSLPNTSFYCQVENMAELMAKADMSIGAGGSATWERCCLGLPTLTQSISFNQQAIADFSSKLGFSLYLGINKNVSIRTIANQTSMFISNKQSNKLMSNKCQKNVDGYGVLRVINVMNVSKSIITIVSDKNSWINKYIPKLIAEFKFMHYKLKWVHDLYEIEKGDFVFYLGCSKKIPLNILQKNRHNLVVHESDLPHGKGWSPLTWQILEGKNEIPISLFEAAATVDSGPVYLKKTMLFEGTELVEELRKAQAETSIEMCLEFVIEYPYILDNAVKQKGKESFYLRRTSEDSILNPDKTIREQFNLLRVVDNEEYPAYFFLFPGRLQNYHLLCSTLSLQPLLPYSKPRSFQVAHK